MVLGAGLGGSIAAFEIKAAVGDKADVTAVSKGECFSTSCPPIPGVAVNWRKRRDIEVGLPATFKRKGVAFNGAGARKVDPASNRLELEDGSTLVYDYLVIATGPDLAFDEIPGLGPHNGATQSICHVDHAERAAAAFEAFCANPGPIVVGVVQGSGPLPARARPTNSP